MRASTSRVLRAAAQAVLGGFLITAGTAHLTFAREAFQAQVPSWVPVDTDRAVLASGVIEIGLGSALLTAWQQPTRALVGATSATFFVAIFPGNLAQYRNRVDAFLLDTDTKRAVRLAFQPLLVAWALSGTEATTALRGRVSTHRKLSGKAGPAAPRRRTLCLR